ncbi:embryonic polarity protein dorsal isoform X2 [Anopheles aquasalis]|uniref:embryonic polarity protein dorsal isoform X2 n=1 Tax=Anopheles aquasalis TaxID=42839 RepID=UPI00215B02EF|nr:embryonic polarity protein dorsal isoform X2 [Anopheles aquasalis]XP_050084424.1 embryonic polarity protein dorsal isoform X2 [Anopheles aquasalis]XP_050084425.1 embryonic polarity protein dorsal isoform X2 [Anopheles aquasalis]XP_050084426.1 embryonic polarity protein dorsal isoform X2 [Anopheles aquasalis]XP_050084427.1 embryonic polarity protein dorsal isoform X2 [Anopheles aquasalis]XP_050084428.1 embryonic polarity protein dorsal isoform X2 [Anopheles aquasalis]XP_050084429.1 embryoni
MDVGVNVVADANGQQPVEEIFAVSDLLDDIIGVIGNDIKEAMPPLPKPFVEITEQPHPKAIRFRYLCEGRSAGSIPGVNTTADNKTFPTIRVQGYRGRAVVVVSCVTVDGPAHKPHPHNLVGKDCKKGVCTVEMNSTTMSYSFNNLGIQCVKKKEVAEALKQRLEIRVDPFRTGFNHATEASSIDLNAVRLCFQVFLEGKTTGRFTEPLTPVVSDVIYDKKAMSDLTICRLSDCSAPVSGGKNIIMLCEKVVKEDIRVRFYEMQNNGLVWEGNGEFTHTDVHKQVAISFRTPPYRTLDITEPVTVFVRLERPSDNACSESLEFLMTPLDTGRRRFSTIQRDLLKNASDSPEDLLYKRILLEGSNRSVLEQQKQQQQQQQEALQTPKLPPNEEEVVIVLDTPIVEDKPFAAETVSSDQKTNEWIQRNEFSVPPPTNDGDTRNNNLGDDRMMIVSDNNNNFYQTNSFDLPDGGVNQYSTTTTTTAGDGAATATNEVAAAVVTAANGAAGMTDEDQTLNELLEQVAELDEIYTDHQLRRENMILENDLKSLEQTVPVPFGSPGSGERMDIDEVFDDAATYTSLQRAFKNPLSITLGPPVPPRPEHTRPLDAGVYDAVEPLHVPTIDVTSLKRESQENEKLPPLPPKRAKPSVQNKENTGALEPANDEVLLNTIIRKGSMRSLAPRPQSDQIIIMKTPDSPPTKKLPPTPPASPSKAPTATAATSGATGGAADFSTLPKNASKKPGFFSKLFSRKKSKSDLTASTNTLNRKADDSVDAGPVSTAGKKQQLLRDSTGRGSFRDGAGEKRKAGKPVARSVSSVSARRPASEGGPDYIYIPLKGDGPGTGMQSRNGGSGTHLSLPGNDSYERASTASLPPLDRKTVSALQLDVPIQDGNLELVAIADARSIKNLVEGNYGVQLDPSVDLTEAEHFALYTSIAPNAALSEFDETSCYYAPVEPGPLANNTPQLQHQQQQQQQHQQQQAALYQTTILATNSDV